MTDFPELPDFLSRAQHPELNRPKRKEPKKKELKITGGWRDIRALTAAYRAKKRRRPVRDHMTVGGHELS